MSGPSKRDIEEVARLLGTDIRPGLFRDLSKQIKDRWFATEGWFQRNYPYIPDCRLVETRIQLPGDTKRTYAIELRQNKSGFQFYGQVAPVEQFNESNFEPVVSLTLDQMLDLADFLPEYKNRYLAAVQKRKRALERQIRIFDKTLSDAGIDLDFDKEGN